jgi:hypothetical protein
MLEMVAHTSTETSAERAIDEASQRVLGVWGDVIGTIGTRGLRALQTHALRRVARAFTQAERPKTDGRDADADGPGYDAAPCVS